MAWMCSPKIHMLNTNLQGDGLRRWLGHGAPAIMNEMTALIKEAEKVPLPLPSGEVTVGRWLSMSSPDTKAASVDFPGFGTMRNKFLLLIGHLVSGILL